MARFDATRGRGLDVFWTAIAGPAASFGGLLLALELYSAAPIAGVIHDLLWAMVGLSVVCALNILPFRFQERRGATLYQSDGRLALDALKVARAYR
jgi:hypothetical protein